MRLTRTIEKMICSLMAASIIRQAPIVHFCFHNWSTPMAPYYKDGYLEAILFIFIDGDKILVEHRPKDGGTETFIPNGKIEDFDFADSADYRVAALRREVAEEFDNHVEVVGYAPLGVFRAE